MTKLTTSQAAMAVGVSRTAIYNWIRQGKIAAPNQAWIGESSFRFWTREDIERVKNYKLNRRPKLGRPCGARNRE